MEKECTCGQQFRTAEDYRDHLPCTAELDKVRAHPEYQAMFTNLTNTQKRCTQLLEAMRRTRKELRNHSMSRFEVQQLIERELDGVDGDGPG
jgi:hypothetical protein